MSNLQTALIVLFLVFSIAGGNGVVWLHYRRTGKRRRSLSDYPLFHFNAKEWLLFLGVFVISMAIGVLAIFSGSHAAA